MVDLEPLIDADDVDFVQVAIMKHVTLTGSRYAERLLADWASLHRQFVKVMPRDYKRALAEQATAAREERGARRCRHGDRRRRQARTVGEEPVPAGADGRSQPESMGKPTGFIEIQRKKHPTRPIEERVHDWREVYLPSPTGGLMEQGARCMDCGIPFCHQGCPLGNLIPDWNDLVYRDRWRAAIDRLHATNNFPEFTGTLCPAPCEGSCVLGINDDPVTIKYDRGRRSSTGRTPRGGSRRSRRRRARGRRSPSSDRVRRVSPPPIS